MPAAGRPRIAGIVPAAGHATGVHNYPKELLPIGIDRRYPTKFVTCSEEIVAGLEQANVEEIRIVVNESKSLLVEHFGRSEHFRDGLISFGIESARNERQGMPYSIASQSAFLRNYDTVLMGMPDTVLSPRDSFKKLLERHRESGVDLSLGVYAADHRNRGGFITFDPISGEVRSHVDKTSDGFPSDAWNAWAIAAWSRCFLDFLCNEVKQNRGARRREFLFGEIIDAAIAHSSVSVHAHLINEEYGSYWDLGDPARYFEFLRKRASLDGRLPGEGAILKQGNLARSFFISYPSTDRVYAQNLAAMLKAYGARVLIDVDDVQGSVPIDTEIGDLMGQSSDYILLLSSAALQSEWVRAELSYARMNGKLKTHIVRRGDLEESEANADDLGRFRESLHRWIEARDGSVEPAAKEILDVRDNERAR